MKTILHLIETSGPGGAEKMLISLVERLDHFKYKSIVCLLKRGWLNDELRGRGLETIIIPQIGTIDLKWILHALRVLKERNIALMHAHEFTMNTYGSIVSAISGVPCITTVHGKNYYSDRRHRRIAYRFASRKSTMVAVSGDIKEFLIQRIKVSGSKIYTIPNGIDLALYRPDPIIRAKMRSELGVKKERRIIGCVGNLYPVKGHSYLLQALAALKQDFPGVLLLLIGRGNELDSLVRQASILQAEENVRFLGFREDVPALLQAIDVFVLPSVSEGLPLAILEAMAACKPIVATCVGGIPEVVKDGHTGLLVPPADPGLLARKIGILLRDTDYANQLVQKAAQVVALKFGVMEMVRRYEDLYKTIAS